MRKVKISFEVELPKENDEMPVSVADIEQEIREQIEYMGIYIQNPTNFIIEEIEENEETSDN